MGDQGCNDQPDHGGHRNDGRLPGIFLKLQDGGRRQPAAAIQSVMERRPITITAPAIELMAAATPSTKAMTSGVWPGLLKYGAGMVNR